MSYQVLARRYRPRRFEEVVGQESVAATLRGAILQERLAHAYLFTGPRGVGKTSMARIFAKALNCPRAADRSRDRSEWGQPCDACPTCEGISLGQDIDVVELDGASHRGIEDIRTIVESVHRPPTRSQFKVFIIDEVHMLTREAFNALLKTLEEPPPHVKFIFATTEAHRIPDTVLSRCQRFDFHPIEEGGIVRRLSQILQAEGRTAEEGVVEKLARYGRGGLRDAQTLLDQLMTFAEDPLRLEHLDRMTGRLPEGSVTGIVDAATGGDPAGVLEGLRDAFGKGADPVLLLEQVLDAIRSRIHAIVSGGGLETRGPHLDRLIASTQILLDAASRIKGSTHAEVVVEVVLLKLSRLEDPAGFESVLRTLLEIERRDAGKPATSPPPARGAPSQAAPRPAGDGAAPALRQEAPPPARPAPRAREVEEAETDRGAGAQLPQTGPEPASPCDFRKLLSLWDQLRLELEGKHPDIAPFFKDTNPVPLPEAPDIFRLELQDVFHFRQMKSAPRQEAFAGLVRDVTKCSWKIRIEHAGQTIHVHSGASPRPGPAGQEEDLPGILSRGGGTAPSTGHPRGAASVRSHGESLPEGPRTAGPQGSGGISRDPIVKKSLDLFNGRLV